MTQRSGTIYNLINNPIVYKIIQKVMSGTSFRANFIKKKYKKKEFKNSRYRLWTRRNFSTHS